MSSFAASYHTASTPQDAHRHRVVRSRDTVYDGCTRNGGRAADGGITRRDECSCGVIRMTNINGAHRASSGWFVESIGE